MCRVNLLKVDKINYVSGPLSSGGRSREDINFEWGFVFKKNIIHLGLYYKPKSKIYEETYTDDRSVCV